MYFVYKKYIKSQNFLPCFNKKLYFVQNNSLNGVKSGNFDKKSSIRGYALPSLCLPTKLDEPPLYVRPYKGPSSSLVRRMKGGITN